MRLALRIGVLVSCWCWRRMIFSGGAAWSSLHIEFVELHGRRSRIGVSCLEILVMIQRRVSW